MNKPKQIGQTQTELESLDVSVQTTLSVVHEGVQTSVEVTSSECQATTNTSTVCSQWDIPVSTNTTQTDLLSMVDVSVDVQEELQPVKVDVQCQTGVSFAVCTGAVSPGDMSLGKVMVRGDEDGDRQLTTVEADGDLSYSDQISPCSNSNVPEVKRKGNIHTFVLLNNDNYFLS